MEKRVLYLSFTVIALLLFIYTFVCVNETHHFELNAGWETNLIEAKWLFYLVSAIGIGLWVFYHFFAKNLYSEGLIYLHVISYLLLAIVLIFWDNNSFSLQEAVESQTYNSVEEIKSDYHNVMDRTDLYRSLFWLLLLIQPIGLVNLILGFIKPNTK
ncbi:hypothetical protein [Sphingobacterium bovistauri]|uniref:DUF4199 domain-containing protein n=1 Tax=Sphingobacterium bovistauri TaxID=2781959 RepID=A0ABS7Z8Y7_9SPHI|nr:hypothetical protein [Sphingobacterium bovistauri]MCA5006658.1 hypothetical protein [Sphingobacterium bovistauri]